MKIITLLNEKGGVGKTTLACHLAGGLAARGQRVLLIDGDPQGHSTVRWGLKKAPGLYDLLVREAHWKDVTKRIAPERYGVVGDRLPDAPLYVLPSNVETRNIANSISDADRLALRLDELRKLVDVVVIDTSPTPSLLHGVFYTATDHIIYPTKLSLTSFDGLVESIEHRRSANVTRQARWRLPEINILGIVPVEYRSNTNEQQVNLDELGKHFGDLVWEPIPISTLWTECETRLLPVWSIEPRSPAATQAWALVDRVQEVMYEPA